MEICQGDARSCERASERASVSLAVMTLCLWAVYLPQQHKAKMDDASLPRARVHMHTHRCVSPFCLHCFNCLPPAFSLSLDTQTHTHTDLTCHKVPLPPFFCPISFASRLPSHLCCNMPINDAAPARAAANFLPLTESEECSCGVHALLCTTPSNLSTSLLSARVALPPQS